MMQHERFAVLILTHGRPDRVYTYETLKRCGYTGEIVFVLDDEDKTADQYRTKYPNDRIVVFSKSDIASRFDEGDNFNDRRAIFYARNASFEIAQSLGLDLFMQLDDDYIAFTHKRDAKGRYLHGKPIKDLDAVLDAMIDYFLGTPALSIAMAQTGDFIGGTLGGWDKPKRKAMNSFLCSTSRPFKFVGRVNEDVNTYAHLGSKGGLFLTTMHLALQQQATQTNSGGMTDMYLAFGTYVKTFYSVMYQPSSVKISLLNTSHSRIHHKVSWRNTVPCILSDEYRKPQH